MPSNDRRDQEYTRLQAIVRSITECIKSVDRDCRLTDMNPAGLNLISAECLEQVKGKSILDLIDPAYHEQFKNGVRRVFKGETIDQEFEIVGLDGKRRWMHQMAVPFVDPILGEVTEMIAVTRDISKRKEQAAAIAKMRRSELISNLSAGIAHDFNNILGIILGAQEVLALSNSQPQLNKPIDNIESAVKRASNLTSKLLKSSKQSPLKVELVTIKELSADLKSMFSEAIPNNIVLNWEVDECLDEKVNQYELEDVLLNLVLNAKNAIEHHGTIHIRIARKNGLVSQEDYFVHSLVELENFLTIEVEDNGCGIDKGKFEEIFLPFKSFRSSGTGLGLSMVYGYALRYNYGLSLRSVPQKGSCFTIWIPFKNVANDRGVGDLPANIDTSNQPLNIVLIDDEFDLLQAFKQLLECKNHVVQAFQSPAAALQYIDETTDPIDVIVTDEVMPGELQGHDLIKRFSGHIPIVLITGYSRPENVIGIEDLLLKKPFTIDELLTKIDFVLRRFNQP